MRLVDSWRRRTGPERFETYTRWTLYLLLAFLPLLAVSVVGASELTEERVAAFTAYAGLVLLEAGVAILVISQGVTAFRDSTPVRRGPVAFLVVVTAAAVVAAVLGLPSAEGSAWSGREPRCSSRSPAACSR